MLSIRTRRTLLWPLVALAGAACEGPAQLGPPEPGEIRGRYIRFDGSPKIRVPIAIGDQRTVTGLDGGFRFTGVDAPYDLVVGHPWLMIVYENVTRSDPIITDPDTQVGSSHIATLSGQIPIAPDLRTLVFVTGVRSDAAWMYADPPTGTYHMEVHWDGNADSRRATLYALRRRDAAIVDLAVKTLRLTDRQEQTVVLDSGDFAPVPTFEISGSVQMPLDTQSYVVRMLISIAGSSMMLDALHGSHQRLDSFTFTAPLIGDGVYEVDISTVRSGYSGFPYSRVVNITPATGPLSIQLYNPPTLLSPPDEAVVEVATAACSWAAGEGPGMYQFVLSGSGTTYLYTTRTQISVGDTPALAGELQPGHGYFWSILKLHAASNSDELLTLENRGALSTSRTTHRKFIVR